VLITISDRKKQIAQASPNQTKVRYYKAIVINANDYYPFGMQMPGRKFNRSTKRYRFGFNGKEADKQVNGEGNIYDYGFRIYNTRIGKFLSVDPLTKSYPELTPYQFASNMPILSIDVDGLEALPSQPTTPSNSTCFGDLLEWHKYQTPQQREYVSKLAPLDQRLLPQEYPNITLVTPFNSASTQATKEHTHTTTINAVYEASGGDEAYRKNAYESGIFNTWQNNTEPIRPGTIIDPTTQWPNLAGSQSLTNMKTALYTVNETGSEKNWINLMLGGFVRGEIAENIIFSENGTVSNYMKDGQVYQNLISAWHYDGNPMNSTKIYPLNYDMGEQISDFLSHKGGYPEAFLNISNFVGTAYGTLLANPTTQTVTILITNITSVHSGDYEKHKTYHLGVIPPSIRRDPSGLPYQRYANFSQTFRLTITFSELNSVLNSIYSKSLLSD
jgi:RHS repeat-associated protein